MTSSPPKAPFGILVSLAWREARSTRRRLLLYMSSISLGVAALVAIDSFAGNITESVREQSRALVGGDVALSTRAAWTPAADSILDSLATTGVAVSRETGFASMAITPRTGRTRLSQVRAVTDGFPLYGVIETDPAGKWQDLHAQRIAIVDPSLLIALDAQIGDTLQLGYAHFIIAATLKAVPGDGGFSSAFGPRLFISDGYVDDTKLLTFGSRAEYDAFVRLAPGTDIDAWLTPLRPALDSARVRARTVSQREDSLADAIDQLSGFLGIVGIVALLLGGVGVASGVNAWVSRKIDIVAVLRCVGATSRQILLIYVTQAAIMGLLGATLGAAIGVGIQFLLPQAVSSYLPLNVQASVEWSAIALGVTLGLWIALAFSLRPLLALRNISPLQAIRRSVDASPKKRRFDPMIIAVNAFIVLSVVGISATRTRSPREVLAFSAGIGVVVLALWLSAVVLSKLARVAGHARWPYVVRQGVANLYRPANQTRSVILSLGFGAFLVTTLYLVQSNLLEQIRITEEASRGNLVLFDIQEDQGAGVDSIALATPGVELLQRTPIVTMRIAAVNGVEVRRSPISRDASTGEQQGASDSAAEGGEATADSTERRPGGWAQRREYRSTYRDTLFTAEKLIAGKWFGESAVRDGEPVDEVSLEVSIAADLDVTIGDRITWDVQGALVETRVTSLREVNWARFEPNFYAVFPSRTIEKAPQTFVALASAPDSTTGRFQRDLVLAYPNVASVDLTLIRNTVSEISRQASTAIQFLTLFSLAMGVPVLFSAVAATRRERVREGVLLKTLGATRQQIGRILFSEYALLGLLGSATGMVLSIGGAWALMRWVFERPFAPALLQASAIAFAMLALAVSIGLLSGRDVFKETAMSALRDV